MTGLSQTGNVGLLLWQVTLLVLLLKIPPAEASYLSIWIALIGIAGRAFGAWLSDAIGRRWACPRIAVRGGDDVGRRLRPQRLCRHRVMFFILVMLQSFFANGNFAVVFPYMAELWPAHLRASGFGLVYGMSNLRKFIGPAGLAVIAGATNYFALKATLAAVVPGFNYFAAWYVLAIIGFLFVGIETRGRTIEELDAVLVRPVPAAG
jgi:putative MFS transporter